MATINLSDVANPNIKTMAGDLLAAYNAAKENEPITAERVGMDQQIQNLLQGISTHGLQSGAQDYLRQGLAQTQQGIQQSGQTVGQAQAMANQQGRLNTQTFGQAREVLGQSLRGGQPNLQSGQSAVNQAIGQLGSNQYIGQGANIIGQSAAGLQSIGQGQGAQTVQDIISGGSQFAQSTPIQGQIDALRQQRDTDIQNLNKQVSRNLQENALPSLYRGAVAGGNIGSSRSAIAEGIAQRGATEALSQGTANLMNTEALKEAALRTGAFNQGVSQTAALGGRNQATQLAALQGAGQQGTGLLGAASQQRGQAQALGSLGLNQAGLGLDQAKLGLAQGQALGSLAGQQASAGTNLANLQLQAANTQGNLAKLNAGTAEMGATQLQSLSGQDLVMRLQAAQAVQDDKQQAAVYDALQAKAEQDQALKNILPYLQPMMAIGGQGYIQPNTGQDIDPWKALLYTAGAGVASSAGQGIGQSLGNAFSSWMNS